MLSCRTLCSLDLLASTIVIHQQLWTLRHLEDALVEVTQDSYGRLPQNMRQSDIQIEKAQSTWKRSAGTLPEECPSPASGVAISTIAQVTTTLAIDNR